MGIELQHRDDIDGLRAVAILSVVSFHAFPTVLGGGFVGVDVFFVISGFLISSIIFRGLEQGEFSFVDFYARRVRRIFPALVLVLAACFAFGWFALLPDEYAQLGKHMAAGAGFVQNFVLWKEAGYFDVSSDLKPLLHLWSLAIEEQFYLVYPLLAWAAWRARLGALEAIAGLALLSFGLNLAGIHKDAVRTFYLPHTRFWELLAGGVLAYVALRGSVAAPRWLDQQRTRSALSLAGLALLVASVVAFHRGLMFPGAWALLPVLAACLFILAGPSALVNRTLLAHPLMVWVGLVSYPLYLWHWPLLSFARIMEAEMPSRGLRIAAVALSFLLAWLTYRWVEKPIRTGRKTWEASAALAVVLALVGVAGYVDFRRDGLSSRDGMQEFMAAREQFELKHELRANPECRKRYHPDYPDRGFCVVSGAKAPTVVVIGDSHANHLFPGLARELAPAGETVANFGDSGCPPLFDTASHKQGEPDPARCIGLMNRMLAWAERAPSVHTIVMSDIGAHYLYSSSRGWGRPEDGPNEWILSRRDLAGATNAQVYETGLRETLARLVAARKRVILVTDNPDLGFSPKSCVGSRPLRIGGTLRTPCAVPTAEIADRSKTYLDLVAQVARDFPTVRRFDASAPFCDAQWCWATREGRMLYRDRSHLSIAGSDAVATLLAPVILQH